MSPFGRIGGSPRVQRDGLGAVAGDHDVQRRESRDHRLAGTLACNRCDAPIALIAGPVTPHDMLTCPFCSNHAPARDFLSLALPTRPARVEVHIHIVGPASSEPDGQDADSGDRHEPERGRHTATSAATVQWRHR
jgi:hypothetical protein